MIAYVILLSLVPSLLVLLFYFLTRKEYDYAKAIWVLLFIIIAPWFFINWIKVGIIEIVLFLVVMVISLVITFAFLFFKDDIFKS